MKQATPTDIFLALQKSWSAKSSSLYTPENPAKGQCGVTALVVNDLLWGKILKTCIGEQWHFYNELENNRYDFTADQFESPPAYDDLPASREEALEDTNELQFVYLSTRVIEFLFDASR